MGLGKIVLLILLGLFVFGPQRLPGMAARRRQTKPITRPSAETSDPSVATSRSAAPVGARSWATTAISDPSALTMQATASAVPWAAGAPNFTGS